MSDQDPEHPRRPLVAIVGAGAIGGTVAVHLTSAETADVAVCVRAPVGPLTLETPSGLLSASPRVALAPADVGRVDWVLLATKAHQTEGARRWLEALCAPGVALAVLQNGVEHVERVAPYANGADVLPVVISCAADRLERGRFRQRGDPRFTVPEGLTGRRFRELLASTTIVVECTDDFTTALWRKLCANAVGGALTALTGQPIGVMRRPDIAELARGLLRESVAVARAEGARLEEDFSEQLVSQMQSGAPDASPSILKDAQLHRPLEHDARNAVVPRIGARHGIPTPLNTMAAALLAAASARNEGG